jgi:major membrane immunogen (membrane-anchored lipoprotein)
MKNKILCCFWQSILILILFSCMAATTYKHDGVFEGRSCSRYTNEPYVGISKIYIENGTIRKIEFKIMDTTKNELFDDKYENHYIGNDLYINQCRNDWKGVLSYPQKLIETQKIEEVDAVSGATWSYNMFKSSVQVALQKATY